MKAQFEIWRYIFPNKEEHSVVIISPPDRAANAAVVNVLYCTSQRQSRQPKSIEVLLDAAEGMDWKTFCDCSLLFAVPAEKLFGKRGIVTHDRRNAIRAKLRDIFRLLATD